MSKNREITLITGNEGKVQEFERLLGFQINYQKLDLLEIQSTDVRRVSEAKATEAYKQLNVPVLVDDTGLIIEAWGELPGALIRWFLDNVGNDGILRMLDDSNYRKARVITSLGYMDKNGLQIVAGEVQGTIADKPRGQNGFGYDAIFVPDGCNRTFAEMTPLEKDSVSMRALALQALKDKLWTVKNIV